MDIPIVSATRRNHAIEHATIAVLFHRRGRTSPVLGRSDAGGFHIHSSFTKDEVASAADEAITRLQSGERHLAVTHLCGTNIAVTGVLAGTAALVAAGRDRRQGWPRAMSAALLATVAAARVGLWLQSHATTDASIGKTRVLGIQEIGPHHLRVRLGS